MLLTLMPKAKCALCKDVIESISVHDFKYCSCKEIFVDGGSEYFRAGAVDFKNLIILSEKESEHES